LEFLELTPQSCTPIRWECKGNEFGPELRPGLAQKFVESSGLESGRVGFYNESTNDLNLVVVVSDTLCGKEL
jgi:hypothetical protein